jgi:hypothetical protein
MSNFLSGIAVILSLIAGVMGVFTVYKVSSVEQQVGTLNQAIANQRTVQTNLNQGGAAEVPPAQNTASPASEAAPSANNAPAANNNVVSIQPGQFVQPALENRAEVELLTVKRIQDPETGSRDVVNVQFRVRQTGSKKGGIITPVNTTARNPETGETYDSYRTAGIKADKKPSESRATSSVLLRYDVSKGASADAYVWMKIPEGVNTVDLYIPETQIFRNVPIAS